MGFDPVYAVLGGIISTLVGLVAWQERRITRGDLVARQIVLDIREDAKERLIREKEISDEKDQANRLLAEALERQGDLIRKLVDGQELTKEVLQSLRAVALAQRPITTELPSPGGSL